MTTNHIPVPVPNYQRIAEWASLTMHEINAILPQVDAVGQADEWNNHNLREMRNGLIQTRRGLQEVESGAYSYESCTCGECLNHPVSRL